MIFTLNILIDLFLIFAVWRIGKDLKTTLTKIENNYQVMDSHDVSILRDLTILKKRVDGKFDGLSEKAIISSKIAEKYAERAFSMASSANLGVIALQKALVVPRILSKPQVLANQLAKKGVDDIFSSDSTFEFMRPYLDDEENEQIDKIIEERNKGKEI